MSDSSHLTFSHEYIESLYRTYLKEPTAVSPQLRQYFSSLVAPSLVQLEEDNLQLSDTCEQSRVGASTSFTVGKQSIPKEYINLEHEKKQMRVLELINSYRYRGHKRANLDPLGLMERPDMPILTLEHHQLSKNDLETYFSTGSFYYGAERAKLRDILQALEFTYCDTIGAEYSHIIDKTEQDWVQQRLEGVRSHPAFDKQTKLSIFERLTAAEGLERYLHNRYPGTKRFGLEGGDSLLPMLHELLQRAGSHNVVETVIGMAHRGRLNVLVNLLGKHPKELFDEFDGKSINVIGSGDVKYHMGFSSNVMTPGGEMHLALAFNPSHLEIVGPVIEGSVRARQDRRKDYDREKVLPVSIHGDAAFAGQGVVMETFQMSQTRGFCVGGTIHIIVNNQIGFTTSFQEDARSTEYCTEIAKMIQAPILHVNADDPEAVWFVTQLAVDYRMYFKKDVVIDLVCYRRRGHNEAEEPMKTQPAMYKKIKDHPTTRDLYAKQLLKEGVATQKQIDDMWADYRDKLEKGGLVSPNFVKEPNINLFVNWTPYIEHEQSDAKVVNLSCEAENFLRVAKKLLTVPEGFSLHSQVMRLMDDRLKMAEGKRPIDWGFAETMAYATLLDEGFSVRITGQDSRRGTFSHRYACLHDQNADDVLTPLQSISDKATFDIYDSLLSEEAVLAFEYGYATTKPDTLIIWEAQFGDFANGAQVVVDQFLSSGQEKWGRLCGLVMLLPHGYEGAGPEHSSARLERYLQLCAQDNLKVCAPTTPAQIYHLLRMQIKQYKRRPLIIMSPKSLLRHKLAVSELPDLYHGRFQSLLGDTLTEYAKAKRLILCSGKLYYDLYEFRKNANIKDVSIIRFEQLYPFPQSDFSEKLSHYTELKELVWCQEEPRNQGAWYAIQYDIRQVLSAIHPKLSLDYVGRVSSAAPAVGSYVLHAQSQEKLVKDAFYGDLESSCAKG